jgi:hypothetical protein
MQSKNSIEAGTTPQPIHHVPLELRVCLLENLEIVDLPSALSSGYDLYSAFQAYPRRILEKVLQNSISPAAWHDALACIMVQRLQPKCVQYTTTSSGNYGDGLTKSTDHKSSSSSATQLPILPLNTRPDRNGAGWSTTSSQTAVMTRMRIRSRSDYKEIRPSPFFGTSGVSPRAKNSYAFQSKS